MKTYVLNAEQWLPQPPEKIFPFFADAANLSVLTPDWLDFEVLTPQPIMLRNGALIDYRIRFRGIPMKWRTEIREWNPPHQFMDIQVKGPYSRWQHTHSFKAVDGGTLCEDEVRYRPIGGALINALFVRRDVERIFAFRKAKMLELFGDKNGK